MFDRFLGIDVRRRDDANVHRLLDPPAEPAEFPLLQDAQQLHLRGRRHLTDFVEEQRPAVRELEAPLPPIGGAGERALLVPEDLALQERFGNRGAVDADEWERRTRTEMVNRLRNQFLARPRLAGDQHGRARRRRLLDDRVDFSHLRAVTDE